MSISFLTYMRCDSSDKPDMRQTPDCLACYTWLHCFHDAYLLRSYTRRHRFATNTSPRCEGRSTRRPSPTSPSCSYIRPCTRRKLTNSRYVTLHKSAARGDNIRWFREEYTDVKDVPDQLYEVMSRARMSLMPYIVATLFSVRAARNKWFKGGK